MKTEPGDTQEQKRPMTRGLALANIAVGAFSAAAVVAGRIAGLVEDGEMSFFGLLGLVLAGAGISLLLGSRVFVTGLSGAVIVFAAVLAGLTGTGSLMWGKAREPALLVAVVGAVGLAVLEVATIVQVWKRRVRPDRGDSPGENSSALRSP